MLRRRIRFEGLGIPAEVLIREDGLRPAGRTTGLAGHQGKGSRLGPINGSGRSSIGWAGILRENATISKKEIDGRLTLFDRPLRCKPVDDTFSLFHLFRPVAPLGLRRDGK